MNNNITNDARPALKPPQAITASEFFWALKCGWFGGFMVGLPVALVRNTDYLPTAAACGIGVFVLALSALGLRSLGGSLAKVFSLVLFGILTIAILGGLAFFIGSKIYVDLNRSAPSSSYSEPLHRPTLGSN